MRVVETRVYSFNELSDNAKIKAIDNNRYLETSDSYWSEQAIEDLKQQASLLGITIDNLYFSHSSSQGDGACFTGKYAYVDNAYRIICGEYPTNDSLKMIAAKLDNIASVNKLHADIKHVGHYYHERCTSIAVFNEAMNVTAEIEDCLGEILREFMRYSYRALESECLYLESDEYLMQYLSDSELEFLENGDNF